MKKNKSNFVKIFCDFRLCIIMLIITSCLFYFKTTLFSAVCFGIALGCTLLFTIVYIAGKNALQKAAEQIDKKISIQQSVFEKN